MVSRMVMTLSTCMLSLALAISAEANTRYLVKFKSSSAFQSNAHAVAMAKANANFSGLTNKAYLLNTAAVVTHTLDNVEMMVIESNSALAIAALRTNSAVELVEEEMFHPTPRVNLSRAVGQNYLRNFRKETVETPWGIDAVKSSGAWTTTKGEGVRVLVLDTGVDSGHPALMSRLTSVRNFVSGEDVDDVTDTVGHGTHVAGTILADGQNGLVGVAPEATLLAGKVCSEMGCSTVSVAQGVNWAISEKADVVNMSLGGPFLSGMEAKALQAAEAAGVMIVAASGNDGQGRVSFPAAAEFSFAVGAIDSSLLKADFSNWGPELDIVGPGVDVISAVPRGTGRASHLQVEMVGKGSTDVKSLPMSGSPLATTIRTDIVNCGLGKVDDFANVNVQGKLALISRGEISFRDKALAAIKAGASGVIIYNNAPGILQGAVSEDGSEVAVPVVMIEQSIGEAARNALTAGEPVQFALEVAVSDYASLQGTSMATPHVAGVAALVRAANRNLTPAQVRDLMKATATPMFPNGNNELGSGLVNAEAAVARALSPMQNLRVAN